MHDSRAVNRIDALSHSSRLEIARVPWTRIDRCRTHARLTCVLATKREGTAEKSSVLADSNEVADVILAAR